MQTVPQVLEEASRRWEGSPALKFKTDGGAWETLSWKEYRDLVRGVARAFVELGLEPGKGVSILAANSPEWFVGDLAAIVAGAVPTGHYVTNSPEQVRYIADHSSAQIAIVDTEEQLAKWEAVRDGLPELKAIIVTRTAPRGPRVFSWAQLLELGSTPKHEAEIDRRSGALREDDLATLIYTSGTTGTPKGVMLTHRNLVWTARAIVDILEMKPDDRLLSYLPLSHIAEQIFTLHSPLQAGACTAFAQKIEWLADDLRAIRPTLFLGVPRVWEKIQAGIQSVAAQNSGLKKAIAAWARRVGLEATRAAEQGRPRPWNWGLADKLVFHKVREKLGLDQSRLNFTSAAPIAPSTLDFFHSLGVPVYEVYGMSEVTGPGTFSMPGSFRVGSAGLPAPGTEIRIAEDGEVLMRGPHVFKGYYRNEESTREALDPDGWIHSGDLGSIDERGFLTITGRKKDLIITAGGHNVAPQAIEQALKSIPPVAQAVVVGDRRHYLVTLLTLDPAKLPIVASQIGSPATTPAEAASCALFRRHLEQEVEKLSARFARSETPKKIAILPVDFTVDGGELTPTMKVRRNVVQEKYAGEIESMYR